MIPITIEFNEEKGYTVRQGNKYSDMMCFDEMLGLIATLTLEEDNNPQRVHRVWMRTKEEHEGCNVVVPNRTLIIKDDNNNNFIR